MHTLADLREYPQQGRYAAYDAYRAGTLTCPECDCNKSGDARDPNRVNDACTNGNCRCHDANATDTPELPEYLKAVPTCDYSDHFHTSLYAARRCTYEADSMTRSPWVRMALAHELRLAVTF